MCLTTLFRRKSKSAIPITDTIKISRGAYINILAQYGVVPLSKNDPFDPYLVLAPKAELDRIVPSLVYPADWYAEDMWDCENYAMQAANDAGRLFYCSVVLCLGSTDFGYHGFALTIDNQLKVWLLEPNAGFPWAGQWFEPKENNYVPSKVLV